MAGAHQREGLGQFVVGGAKLAAQQRELAVGDQVEMLVGNRQCEAQPRRVRMQHAQLQVECTH